MERVFDRRVRYDERSRAYPARTLTTATTPRSYTWRCDTRLDQRAEGACVGFAWAHEAAARPVVRPASDGLARRLYRQAQTFDEWPGENYEGSSVLGGAKAAQQEGLLKEYRWAFSAGEALVAISHHGPAVMGCLWYEGMAEPDNGGYIHPTGAVLGGHAILVNGVSVTQRTVRLHNSWGPTWGKNSECLMTWEAFALLLARDGELCVPVVR